MDIAASSADTLPINCPWRRKSAHDLLPVKGCHTTDQLPLKKNVCTRPTTCQRLSHYRSTAHEEGLHTTYYLSKADTLPINCPWRRSAHDLLPVKGCHTTDQLLLVIYCEATHVCYREDAREVTHVILMLLVEQGWSLLNKTCLPTWLFRFDMFARIKI